MAGHSRWANIKHRKQKQDQTRSLDYTRVSRELTVASRLHGQDIESNPRLRAAIEKARELNMSKEMIARAIKRGSSLLDSDRLEEIRYEGYGPSGIAILVDCMTNNRNRTVSFIRSTLTKYGGNLATEGSVAYLFSKKGQIIFSPTEESKINKEALMEIALSAGADDMLTDEVTQETILFTTQETLSLVKGNLVQAGFQFEAADMVWYPTVWVRIEDPVIGEKVFKLLETLEELEEVQAVYTNAKIS